MCFILEKIRTYIHIYIKICVSGGFINPHTYAYMHTYVEIFKKLECFSTKPIHRSLTHDRFTKNVTKKCGWVIVGFFSYFTNLLRAKSDLLGLSSYIDFSISHVNFHLRNLAIFGFFAFIWTHLRPLARKKYSKCGFQRKISR